ncbi:phosphotransferase [Alicyclobacillus dauci]|uniref:Phosphotransferase n=1 Tax=Alicyclobacillus dauci TaxID=1475485 RepID=A0ABY6Z2M6_9BACL|nr:phosphotransferase [Alicyclobacillus dauci]WAH36539.1 phosphotransferase [Alicyclobacillus dauci]
MKLAARVGHGYGIDIVDWTPVKDVYRLRTREHGTLCLKPYDLPIEEVEFIAGVQDDVKRNGFQFVPYTFRTRSNRVGFKHNGNWYMLTRWVVGRTPSFRNENRLHQAVRTLAKFHDSAQNLSARQPPTKRIKTKGIKRRLEHESRKIEENYRGGCAEILKDLCAASLSHIESSKVKRAIRREVAVKAFVHGDYNYPNIVQDKQGRYHLIDFENTSLHVRMEDLAHLIHHNAAWQGERVVRIIDAYDRVRPMSDGDLQLLIALLYQPYPVFRAIQNGKQTQGLSCALLKQYLHRLQRI